MKGKEGLVPVKKMVQPKQGKPHVKTFWMKPGEHEEHKKKTSQSTEDMHKKDGKWTAERAAQQRKTIKKVLESCPKPKPGEKPKCVLLLGGAASGKSTVVDAYVKPKMGDQFGTVNVDDVKEDIPEYEQFVKDDVGTAASRVHEESSEMGKAITTKAIEDGRNFIYDAVLGNPEKAKKMIKELRAKGYEISLVGVNVDAEESLDRASLRAYGNVEQGGEKGGSGRMVPPGILLDGHKGASKTFAEIKDLVDDVSLYDNNVPQGTDPIPVVTAPPQKVLREDLYNDFKGKANLNIAEAVSRYGKKQINKAIELIPTVDEWILEKAISEELNPVKKKVFKAKLERIRSKK